jgi:glycosyltransferase 2 family protein
LKSTFKTLLKFSISILILLLLFNSVNFSLLKNIDFQLNITDIISIVFLLFFSLILRSYRWSMLMNSSNGTQVNYFQSLKLLLIGQTLNTFLPSGTGDIAKSYYGYKNTGIKERMLSISIIDKLIAIGSLLFISLYAFHATKNYSILAAGCLSILPFLLFMNLTNIIKYKPARFMFNFITERIKKIDCKLLLENFEIPITVLFFSFMISILAWISTYGLLFFCFKLIGIYVSPLFILSVIPFLTLGRLFPFTLNGIGSDEALIIYLFSSTGLSTEIIFMGALLYRLILIIFPAILGVPFILNIQPKH